MTSMLTRLVELEEKRSESNVEGKIQQEVEKKVSEAFSHI
jgi:hypothetical protein